MDIFISSIELFILGATVGFTLQCMFSCGPIILPYVLSTGQGWRSGIKAVSILLAGRIFSYSFLGFIAAWSGVGLNSVIKAPLSATVIKCVTGGIIIVMALIVIVGTDFASRFCTILQLDRFKNTNLFLIGVMIGLVPCAPLVAVLFEIMIISKVAWLGILYGLSFGIGTVLASLVLLGPAAGVLGMLSKKLKDSAVIRILCGIWLLIMAGRILWGNN